ncbi:MAG: peptidylprolyl isomerase [Candidatus Hydrogenedentes bacterium]|nr:peptidylprolyl isomerase [Candidatus Hydrogenedentota bacterium]
MQTKLLTIGVIVALMAGLTAYNRSFNQPRLTPEQIAAAKEAEANIEEASTATGEAAPATAETQTAAAEENPAVAAPPAAAPAAPAGPSPMEGLKELTAWPEEAPDVCLMKMELSNGDLLIEVHKEWAPIGAAHFYKLAKLGFYNDSRIFRVVPGFVAQTGIAAEPGLDKQWADENIPDDPATQSNAPGMITFASQMRPNTRSTQFFINTGNNANLDSMGFAPFAKVIHGMDVVTKLNSKYGDSPTRMQEPMHEQGNAFVDKTFPGLDYIKRIVLVERTQ